MAKLEICAGENSAKVTFEDSLFIDTHRHQILMESLNYHAVSANTYKIIFSSEKDMFSFVKFISQLGH